MQVGTNTIDGIPLSVIRPTQDFYHVMIPVKDINSPVKGATTMMRVPMMLPHELLGYLMDSEA